MRIKGLVDEDFVNYKVPSMFIATSFCSFKCEKEYGSSICQNGELASRECIDISDENIVDRYMKNDLTKAIVFGGLEPIDQLEELCRLIREFRGRGVCDDIVVYTGYTDEEANRAVCKLIRASSGYGLVVKYGRFIPNQESHYDNVLGVMLASDNQYAEKYGERE